MPGAKSLKCFAGKTRLSGVKTNHRHCPISMPAVDVILRHHFC
jgi:hypothetical protein